jgi:hypothetical protein
VGPGGEGHGVAGGRSYASHVGLLDLVLLIVGALVVAWFVSGLVSGFNEAAREERRGAAAREERRSRVIPQAVRREVWRRDQGRCVECGSQERLEYDHIIPVSKGGSNTARNVQLGGSHAGAQRDVLHCWREAAEQFPGPTRSPRPVNGTLPPVGTTGRVLAPGWPSA